MDQTKCKEKVWGWGRWDTHQCSRNIWKDGYCKQHHPDTVAERGRKSVEAYEAKKKTECWYQLKLAGEEKEAEIERLEDLLTQVLVVEGRCPTRLLVEISKALNTEPPHE